MRYLSLFPLLVMAFAAPAAADDHLVDLSFAVSFASGSTLTGFHETGSVSLAHYFSAVADVSNHFNSPENRSAVLWGGRFTGPLGKGSPLKAYGQFLAGRATKTVDDVETGGKAFAVGAGLEYFFANRRSQGYKPLGVRLSADYVITPGQADDGFVRVSIGGVLRLKK